MTNQTPPPANWYPDPSNPAGERWWDGSVWTDHVRAKAATPPPPPPPQPVAPLAPQGPSAPPPNWRGSTVPSTPMPHSFAASPVNFGEAMRRALTLWTIRGRASRSEFWWWTLGSSLVYAASSIFLALLGDAGSLITSLGSLFIAVVSFKISIRRYHDVGKGAGTLAAVIGGSFVGGVLVGVGIVLTGVAIYNGTAEEEAIGSYMPIMGGGALILAAFSIWNLIILCQPGKPERNRFDA